MKQSINKFFFSELTSTNGFLKEILNQSNEKVETDVLADYQTKGKGLENNIWHSLPSLNLLASFLRFPEKVNSSNIFVLNKAVSVSVLEFLKDHGLNNVSIKWPNDILVEDKKICGILIQNSITGDAISNSIIGVGLNINQNEFPFFKREATSFLLETGKEYQIFDVFDSLSVKISSALLALKRDLFCFDRIYLENLYLYQRWQGYLIKGQRVNGKIEGVSASGALQMRISSEEIVSLKMKEVEFL